MDCKQCGKPLVGGRSNRRYCDKDCLHAYHSAAWHSANPKSPVSQLKTGAVAECNLLRVCLDLLKRSEHIQLYRALFPGQDANLVATSWGSTWSIEVVSGNRTAKGKIMHAKRHEKYDVLAVVLGDEIVYQPEWGQWPFPRDWKEEMKR
jgi:hypothetical protein